MFPEARICGHRDLPGVAKACPCFDAIQEYKYIFAFGNTFGNQKNK